MKEWEHATQQEIDEAIKAIGITIKHLKVELETARKERYEFVEQMRNDLFILKFILSINAVVVILVSVAYILWKVI